MKIIYDKLTGYIYTTAYIDGEITPAVIEVDNPENKLISKIILEEGREPRVEFYENYENRILKELEETKKKIEEVSTKQINTEIALAELTMNAIGM